MKKKKIQKEQWKVDSNWFVHHRDHFFSIGAVDALTKSVDNSLGILIGVAHINVNFHGTPKDRDAVFDMLKKARMAYYDGVMDRQKEQRAIHRAQLEIQNRMAGKMCG